MTNLVVWLRQPSPLRRTSDNRREELSAVHDGDPAVWIVADTRVTDPSRISDQATKILELSVTTHRKIHGHGYQAMWGLAVGFAYAGAVFPAMMSYAALKPLLDNLAPGNVPLPTLHQVANLTAYIVEQYVRAGSRAFGSFPHCQIVLTGMSGFEGELTSILVAPREIYPDFKYESRVLDLSKIHVFGDERDELLSDIEKLIARADPATEGLEPKLALENRIRSNHVRSVGGALQYGVHDGRFKVYAANGQIGKSFLGFDLKEIQTLIGFDILLDGLA